MKRMTLVFMACLLLGADEAKKDQEKMQGTWAVVGIEQEGKKGKEEDLKKADLRLTIKGTNFNYTALGNEVMSGTITLDSAKKPPRIDATGKDESGKEEKTLGIYEFSGDTLRVCFVPAGNERPEKFETKAGTKVALITYKRVPK
jgi:uncharacterized protein (TIGR03067 family)